MATISSLFRIICLAAVIGYGMPHRDLLAVSERDNILRIARRELGVRETGGNNFGKQIRTYLRYTNLTEGSPYCAAFVSWVYFTAGYQEPRTAWSPALFPANRRTENPRPADVLGIYSVARRRIVHCGIVENVLGNWVISIEGNTNSGGSSDGDGNYRKRRHRKTIRYFACWLKQEKLH